MRTYGIINYYECLVIVLLMSRWNCLEVIAHHCIVFPCGLIIEKHHKPCTSYCTAQHISKRESKHNSTATAIHTR